MSWGGRLKKYRAAIAALSIPDETPLDQRNALVEAAVPSPRVDWAWHRAKQEYLAPFKIVSQVALMLRDTDKLKTTYDGELESVWIDALRGGGKASIDGALSLTELQALTRFITPNKKNGKPA